MNVLEERYNLNPLKLVIIGWIAMGLAYGSSLIEWDSFIRIVFIMLPLGAIGIAALSIAFLWAPLEFLKDTKNLKKLFTVIMAGIPPATAVTAVLMWAVISPYAYSYDVEIDEYKVRVGFQADHPKNPEYKRFVHIDMYGKIDFGKDKGGIDYINVFDLDDAIVLQTFWSEIVVFDKKNKSLSLIERPLNEEEKQAFVGKFHFVEPNRYGFTYKKDDPNFDSMMMGGDK